LENRRCLSALDVHELPGEVGNGELVALVRAGVVERPGADDVQTRGATVLVAGEVGGGLAGSVGRVGAQGAGFVDGPFGFELRAVDQAAADIEDAGGAAPADHTFAQPASGGEVAVPGGLGIL